MENTMKFTEYTIITENVANRRALQRAASMMHRHMTDNIERMLEYIEAVGGDIERVGEIAISSTDLTSHVGDSEVQAMLDHGIDLEVNTDRHDEHGSWAVNRVGSSTFGTINLTLRINGDTTVDGVRAELQKSREQQKSTILHELQHAFDNWRSGNTGLGRVEFSRETDKGPVSYVYTDDKKEGFLDKRQLKSIFSGRKASHADYLNFTHEINARYAQAIAKTNKDVYSHGGRISVYDYLDVFQYRFVGWKQISDKEKRRLLSRAYAEWDAEFNPNKKRK
jgi:hypothetical protein